MSSNYFPRTCSPVVHSYFLNNSQLQRVSIIKDLGTFYSSTLSFEHHISLTVCRALKFQGFIQRDTKQFKSAQCLRTLPLLRLFLNMMLLYDTLSLRKTNFAFNVFKTDIYRMPTISLRSQLPIMTIHSSVTSFRSKLSPLGSLQLTSNSLFLF